MSVRVLGLYARLHATHDRRPGARSAQKGGCVMVQLPDSPWHEWSEARKIAAAELLRAKKAAEIAWRGPPMSTAYDVYLDAVMACQTVAEVEGVVQGLAGA